MFGYQPIGQHSRNRLQSICVEPATSCAANANNQSIQPSRNRQPPNTIPTSTITSIFFHINNRERFQTDIADRQRFFEARRLLVNKDPKKRTLCTPHWQASSENFYCLVSHKPWAVVTSTSIIDVSR